MSRLSKEEVVVLKKLKKKNEDKASKSALARLFHVRERTVRYHLKREKEGTADKRKNKPIGYSGETCHLFRFKLTIDSPFTFKLCLSW